MSDPDIAWSIAPGPSTPNSLPQVPAQDAATAARASGYEWGDILKYTGTIAATAQAEGYQPHEIDRALGWPDPAPHLNDVSARWSQTLGGDLNPDTVSAQAREDYAQGMKLGAYKGPADYEAKTAGVLQGLGASAGEISSAGFPSFENLTDAAIRLTAQNGLYKSEDVARTRSNLLDLWAKTGVGPQEALGQPMLHDALTDNGPTLWDRAKAIGQAAEEGFGNPQALDPDTVKTLRASGIFSPAQGRGTLPQLFNEGLMQGVAAGFHLLGGVAQGLIQGAAEAGSQIAGEAPGQPGKAYNDLAEIGKVAQVVGMTFGIAPPEAASIDFVTEHLGTLMQDEQGAGRNPWIERFRATQGREPGTAAAPLPPHEPASGTPRGEAARQLPLPLENTTEVPEGLSGSVRRPLARVEAEARTRERENPPGLPQGPTPIYGPSAEQLPLPWREAALRKGELFTSAEMGPPAQMPGEPREWIPGDPQELLNRAIQELTANGRARYYVPAPEVMADDTEIGKIIQRLDKSFHLQRTNSEADKITMFHYGSGLPKELLGDAAKQSRISRDIERRLVDPDAKWGPETQEFVDATRPITDSMRTRGEHIQRMLGKYGQNDLFLGQLRSVDEGYVRRFLKQNPEEFSDYDPVMGREVGNIIVGGHAKIGGNAKVKAGSLQNRADYVMRYLDGPYKGTRIWGEPSLEGSMHPETGEPLGFGSIIKDAEGNSAEIARATMDEIETHTDRRYSDNFWMNTMLGHLELLRVERNVRMMGEIKDLLDARGLRRPLSAKRPESFNKVDVPILGGWVHPRVARVLNEYYQPSEEGLLHALARASNALTHMMFMTPTAHLQNVAAHAFVARGADWMLPGGYGSMVKLGAQALREVNTMGPVYQALLRHGNALMSSGVRLENFQALMLKKLFNEQLAPEAAEGWNALAQGLGFDHIADAVRWEYKGSREILWRGSDVFMVQQVLRLMQLGHPMMHAIQMAEEDIPNYFVPSEVLGSHLLSEFMRSPAAMIFGRYRYSQLRALALMTRDMVGSSEPGEAVQPLSAPAPFQLLTHEQHEALFPQGALEEPITAARASRKAASAKALALGALGLYLLPTADHGLQAVTHNPNAHFAAPGPLTPISHAVQLATGTGSWPSLAGSILTLNALMNGLRMIAWNLNPWGQPVIGSTQGFGADVGEALEGALSVTYPGEMANILIYSPTPAAAEQVLSKLIANATIPANTPEPKARRDYYARREEIGRIRHDSFLRWMREHF